MTKILFAMFCLLLAMQAAIVDSMEEIIMEQLGYTYTFPVTVGGVPYDRMIVSIVFFMSVSGVFI